MAAQRVLIPGRRLWFVCIAMTLVLAMLGGRQLGTVAQDGTLPTGQMGDVFVGGEMAITLPDAEPGALSVVAFGGGNGFSTPVIVMNWTDESYFQLEVGIAVRDADNTFVGVGSGSAFSPARIGPGEIAFGDLFLMGDGPSADTTQEFLILGETEASGFFGTLNASVLDATLAGGRMTGTLGNPHDEPLIGPVSVDVLCFGADGGITGISHGFADAEEIAVGETLNFDVSLFGTNVCAGFIVAASGYNW